MNERLSVIKNAISCKETVLDVGCDHGYIPIRLISEGRARRVIASDINEGPYLRACENVRQSGFCEYIDLRLGGGLSVISPGEAEVIIIAGMGGELIAEILKQDEQVAKTASLFILQPMTKADILRRFLIKNGYKILREHLAKENDKFYNIMEAAPGIQSPYRREIMYYTGDLDRLCEPHYAYEYLLKTKECFETIKSNLILADSDVSDKLEYIKRLLDELDENII